LSGLKLLFPKPYADFVARLRVPCGFAMVAAFAWFSHPDARSLVYGLPVSLIGLAVRAWAAGHLAKNRALAQARESIVGKVRRRPGVERHDVQAEDPLDRLRPHGMRPTALALRRLRTGPSSGTGPRNGWDLV